MESVLQALHQPHVLPRWDDVFFDEEVEETGDLLKEIHGDPIFDVYRDEDPIFDEESNINFIGIQEVENINFVPAYHVHEIDESCKRNQVTCRFSASNNQMINNKPPDQGCVEFFLVNHCRQIKREPLDWDSSNRYFLPVEETLDQEINNDQAGTNKQTVTIATPREMVTRMLQIPESVLGHKRSESSERSLPPLWPAHLLFVVKSVVEIPRQ